LFLFPYPAFQTLPACAAITDHVKFAPLLPNLAQCPRSLLQWVLIPFVDHVIFLLYKATESI
jgi:hypothetical protein